MKGKAGSVEYTREAIRVLGLVPKVETTTEGWRPSTSSCGVAMWLVAHLPLHAPCRAASWIPPALCKPRAAAQQRSADLGPQFSPDPFFLVVLAWHTLIKSFDSLSIVLCVSILMEMLPRPASNWLLFRQTGDVGFDKRVKASPQIPSPHSPTLAFNKTRRCPSPSHPVVSRLHWAWRLDKSTTARARFRPVSGRLLLCDA